MIAAARVGVACLVVSAAVGGPGARAAQPAPEEPPATPAAFSGTTTLISEWRVDNRNGDATDDDYGSGVVRSEVLLDGGDTRLGLRFDATGFASRPASGDRRNDARIERAVLELARARAFGAGPRLGLSLSAGDFYTQFGRGLVLSLRRIDEIGIDIALRGARVELTAGDLLSLTLLGGVANPANLEPRRYEHLQDPGDHLAGARVELRGDRGVLGVHAAGAREADPPLPIPVPDDFTIGYGGSLDASVGPAGIGLDVARQERRRAGGHERGHAVYATATIPIHATTLLVEFKHYGTFDRLRGSRTSAGDQRFLYSLPPTAERSDQELLDNTDITGGRLRADQALPWGASSAYASLGVFADRTFDQWFSHGFAGYERRWDGGAVFFASGGYRREWNRQGGALARAIAHAETDVTLPLREGVSAHIVARHESHAIPLGATDRYVFHLGTAALEINIATRLSVAGAYEYDNQRRVPGVAQRFGFGLVKWRTGDRLTLQLLAGTQKGGVRCLAGACTIQPPFAGVRLDAALRF